MLEIKRRRRPCRSTLGHVPLLFVLYLESSMRGLHRPSSGAGTKRSGPLGVGSKHMSSPLEQGVTMTSFNFARGLPVIQSTK